jgi:hypothetical protein
MSKFEEHLKKEYEEAYLIEDGERNSKTKDDYIVDAEEGVVVAFRLNFRSKSKVKLTKVISGKILENNKDNETYVIETRNGLKYGVPYKAVVWVKTGNRWPKGVYEEMKQGSVEVKDENGLEFEEMEATEIEDHEDPGEEKLVDPDDSDEFKLD